MKPRTLTILSALTGALLTLLISVLPFVRFAYRSPAGHLALDTAAAFIALLAGYLLLGRFMRSGVRSDLVMAYSLLLFGLTNLFLSALGDVILGTQRESLSTWAILGARVIATACFTLSAFVGDGRIAPRRWKVIAVAAAAVTTVAALAVIEIAIDPGLAPVIQPNLSPEASGRPRIVGHPTVLALQLILMAMFAVSSILFTRRAERSNDELLKWFGAAAALGAFSRLNYFLFPSLYSQYLYTGDFLRLGFYALLLAGAAREIVGYWASQAEIAVLNERRRLARDIHDGLGQELLFIRRESERFAGANAARALTTISSAAERALEESRLAVAALTSPMDEPLHVAIAHAANDVAHRLGVTVKHELEEEVVVAPDVRASLLRVVREAVGNAVRHGAADEVAIRLVESNGVTLEIEDDGRGFDMSMIGVSPGFGLSSMKERVAACKGALEIVSSPGNGTVVRVKLPPETRA